MPPQLVRRGPRHGPRTGPRPVHGDRSNRGPDRGGVGRGGRAGHGGWRRPGKRPSAPPPSAARGEARPRRAAQPPRSPPRTMWRRAPSRRRRDDGVGASAGPRADPVALGVAVAAWPGPARPGRRRRTAVAAGGYGLGLGHGLGHGSQLARIAVPSLSAGSLAGAVARAQRWQVDAGSSALGMVGDLAKLPTGRGLRHSQSRCTTGSGLPDPSRLRHGSAC
jgi:hypothetical protein